MKYRLKNECKLTFFSIFVIWTTILISAFYYVLINTDNSNRYYGFYELNNNCFVKNRTQFFVHIDGIKYPKLVPLYENKSIDFKCLNSTNKPKTILLWTKFKGLPLPLVDYKTGHVKPFESFNCPVTNCELTYDRKKLKQSDLVLFHLRNHIDYIPERTSQHQRFVHVIYESPINCHLCTKYKNVFNLSSSYTLKSDYTSIYWSDAGIEWKENEKFDPNYDFYSNKRKLVAAVISNCNDKSFRLKYIDELKKYVNVDVYGYCGSIDCEDDLCSYENISKDYKFYLAFENSICTDYITEKFFNYLKYNIILVTLGGGNYSQYVPKSAYINALDYKTPKDLANYLVYLSENKTAYNEYFKWKKYISFYDENKIINSGYLCEMCIQLHLEERLGFIKKKRLDDLNIDNLFEIEHNCKNTLFMQVAHSLNNSKDSIEYSYYMSPE